MPTNYAANADEGKAGLIANVSWPYQTVGGMVNSDPIHFGRFVQRVPGTENEIKESNHPNNGGFGVAVIDTGIPEEIQTATGFENVYPANYPVTVAKDAEIWVEIDQNVSVEDEVWVRLSTTKAVQDLVFSGNFVTGNSTVATVNGTALAANAFDTDNATTIAALAVLIAAHDDVESATVTGANTIRVTSENGDAVTITTLTTGGASQATSTQTTITAGVPGKTGVFRTDSASGNAMSLTSAAPLSFQWAGNYTVDGSGYGIARLRAKAA